MISPRRSKTQSSSLPSSSPTRSSTAGAIEPRLSRPLNRLRIEIIDHGRDAEIPVTDHDPNRGYGLRIVDQLADSWGAHQGTTHHWADLLIPGHPIHLAPTNRSTSPR